MMEVDKIEKAIQEVFMQAVNNDHYFYGLLIGGVCTLLFVVVFVIVVLKKNQKAAATEENESNTAKLPKPRFRKRDRFRFYATKMMRKVKTFKEDVLPGAEEVSVVSRRRRKASRGFARFLSRQDSEITRMMKEPPASLLEADYPEATASDTQLPAEVMYMFRSVRVFGHFEKPLFFELCKHIITKSLPMGKVLFKPGPMEECIYIVQSGQLNLYIVDKKGTEMLLKKVKAGENIHSVMNILDAIRGNSTYKYSIVIRAAEASQILMLPSRAFKQVFEDNPESLVRIVQIVMLRLQQVTFQAFHRFLGLSTELVGSSSTRRVNEELKSLSVYSLGNSNEKKAETVASPGRITGSNPLNIHRILKIKEVAEDKASRSAPNQASEFSPMRSNASFTNLDRLLGQTKSSSNTSPVTVRRSNSHGRLVNLYGDISNHDKSRTFPLGGPTSSDFEAVLGRVGLDVNEAKFSIGVSDDEATNNAFEFPVEAIPELASDDDLSYGIPSEDEEKMLAAARSDLVKLLTLPTPKMLDNILSIDVIPAGTYLVRQGDKDCGLFFLVQGSLEVSLKPHHDEEQVLFKCVPGEFMGSLSLLTGDPSFFSIYTVETTYVVIISKVNFYKLIIEHPKIVLPVANSLIQKMSQFVRNIDFALDWTMLESGKPLFRQNGDSDSISIVLNGRLRAVRTHESGKKEINGEYGRGEFVGLVEVLTHTERARTVYAVRDTELAQIPAGLLNTIKAHYPQVVSRLIQLLGDRILGNVKNASCESLPNSKLEMIGKNLGTIAVIPASNSVPLQNFTFELGLAINDIGPTLVLTSDVIKKRFGNAVLDSVHEYNLSNWLGHQEDIHRIVVYQADMYMSEWTKRCIRQADAILIVGMGDEEPVVGKLEAELETMTSLRAQKDLILLYDEESFEGPSHTIEWLNARGWVSAHHHVRCPRKVFKRRVLSQRYANDAHYEGPSRQSDFARLARVLTGTSIGLVLGGGGARGISHIGVIKAMYEAGIPIDSIGGTSMGAFIAALYAEHGNVVRTTQRAREACLKMASMWRKLLDMTYPYTSLFTGKAFNAEIESTFGDIQIEDMLLPFFCVTTDISNSSMKVHQTGCVWRYVRASMSLSGYLPPMCDSVDDHLLLDGGYVNNLPADVMRTLGVKTIIAVDVGSKDQADLTNFGDSLSGWWMLWKKLNPFSSPVHIPDMAGIQSRLAYVSCVPKLEEVKNSGYAHYMRPPVDRFKTLQFGSFDEILEVGYHHGKEILNSWMKGNLLTFDSSPSDTKKQIIVGGNIAPSFTDLAELVSQIKAPIDVSRGIQKRSQLFDYRSGDDISDNDEVDFYGRGSLSDQDLAESDFLSGTEELGYESEDIGHLRKRRIFLRMHSNNV